MVKGTEEMKMKKGKEDGKQGGKVRQHISRQTYTGHINAGSHVRQIEFTSENLQGHTHDISQAAILCYH